MGGRFDLCGIRHNLQEIGADTVHRSNGGGGGMIHRVDRGRHDPWEGLGAQAAGCLQGGCVAWIWKGLAGSGEHMRTAGRVRGD